MYGVRLQALGTRSTSDWGLRPDERGCLLLFPADAQEDMDADSPFPTISKPLTVGCSNVSWPRVRCYAPD